MNVAKSLIRRILCISHKSFHRQNMETIRSILAKNNFPPATIERLIHQVIDSPNRKNKHHTMPSYPFLEETVNAENQRHGPMANSTLINEPANDNRCSTLIPKVKLPKTALGFAGLTYIPGISESLSNQLRRHAPDLKLAPRPPNKIAQVFTDMKDKLDTGQQSCVVYEIRCKQCKDKFYYGETSRCLCERCDQHAKDVANLPKKPTKSALVAHVHQTKHQFDFTNAKILKKVRTRGLLKIHEANQIIIHEESAVNFKKDAQHVSPVFYNLIKKCEQFKRIAKEKKKTRSVHHATSFFGQSEQSSEPPMNLTFDI